MAKERLVFSIEAQNKKFRDAIEDSRKRTENLEANLTSITSKAAVAFAGLSASVGFFINEAAKIETINTQFEVLTGSVLGAEKAVAQLQELSASTPFAFEDIASAGKQLLGFGFSVDSLTENLSNLGDVAAASGAPIQELSLIFGQVNAAGKLTGERLLQLQERAIPIGPALAKTMGVAESSIRDLVSKGKVDFETFQQAFRSLSQEGGFAFGGLDKQSQTLSGQISTLKDNFSLLASEVGKELLPVAKELTTALIGVFKEVRNNPEIIKTAASFLKVATVVTGLITALGGATFIFLKLKAAVAGVAVVFGAILTVKAAVVAAVVALISAVTGAVAFYDTNLTFMENITENFAERLKALFGGLASVLKGAFTLDLDQVKDGIKELEVAFARRGENIKAKREELDQDRRDRQAKELEEEKIHQQNLEMQEAEANARKLENQKLLASQQRQIREEEESINRELEAQLNELKLEAGREFTAQEEEALMEALRRKREQKAQADRKDILALLEKKKKEQEIEKRFGKNILFIEQALQSERFKNAQGFAQSTIQLQRSSNSTLKGIGKAAAVTQIGIDTAQGAIAAYKSLAGIPFVGPVLGAAAAAAVVAFGAEQTGRVLAAQQGGVVPGIGRGDKIPAMLEPGELVVPRQNFEDVVAAETSRREGEGFGESGSGIMEVIVGFRDDAFEIIEEKLIERRRFDGVGLGALG